VSIGFALAFRVILPANNLRSGLGVLFIVRAEWAGCYSAAEIVWLAKEWFGSARSELCVKE